MLCPVVVRKFHSLTFFFAFFIGPFRSSMCVQIGQEETVFHSGSRFRFISILVFPFRCVQSTKTKTRREPNERAKEKGIWARLAVLLLEI
jgi:hypothetical protein